MTCCDRVSDPFSVVAKALSRSRDSLSIESAMYRDHGWDSFGHVSVIAAIEEACGISVTNQDVLKYTTMRAIVALFDQHREVGQREG